MNKEETWPSLGRATRDEISESARKLIMGSTLWLSHSDSPTNGGSKWCDVELFGECADSWFSFSRTRATDVFLCPFAGMDRCVAFWFAWRREKGKRGRKSERRVLAHPT